MISPEELAYREQVLAETRQWAQVQMPALLRSARGQRLQPMQTVASPATPLPEPPVQLPDTGSIPRLRETTMIPAVRLLKPAIAVHETNELVSQAVRLFTAKHGCLPSRCLLNLLRVLTIEPPDVYPLNDTCKEFSFYPLDEECAELGCYTISVASADGLPIDTVRLLARGLDGTAIREDYSL